MWAASRPPHWSARPGIELQRPVTNDRLSAHHEMSDSRRGPRRYLVGRMVAECIRLKDDDVSVRSHGEGALPRGTAHGGREHAGGEQARAADELGKAQRALPD